MLTDNRCQDMLTDNRCQDMLTDNRCWDMLTDNRCRDMLTDNRCRDMFTDIICAAFAILLLFESACDTINTNLGTSLSVYKTNAMYNYLLYMTLLIIRCYFITPWLETVFTA